MPEAESPQEQFAHQTSGGELRFWSYPPSGQSNKLAVLIPGAFRNAATLAPFAKRVSALVTTVTTSLPGFGGSQPFDDTSIDAYGRAYLSVLAARYGEREIVLVGESLGALVALRIAGLSPPGFIRHVVALDPPLSTAKQWPIHLSLRQSLERQPNYEPLKAFALNMFGYRDADTLVDHLHFDLLRNASVSVDLVTGTEPLFPFRDPVCRPCLLDETDLYIASKFEHVRVHRVLGGDHTLTESVPDACEAIVRQALEGIAT